MKTFNILGQEVPVLYISKAEEFHGEYSLTDKTITIAKNKDKKQERLALLHEFIHAVFDRSGVALVMKDEVEEIVCEVLSQAIDENFSLRRR